MEEAKQAEAKPEVPTPLQIVVHTMILQELERLGFRDKQDFLDEVEAQVEEAIKEEDLDDQIEKEVERQLNELDLDDTVDDRLEARMGDWADKDPSDFPTWEEMPSIIQDFKKLSGLHKTKEMVELMECVREFMNSAGQEIIALKLKWINLNEEQITFVREPQGFWGRLRWLLTGK